MAQTSLGSGLITLHITPQGRKSTLFRNEAKDISLELSKASLVSFGNKIHWKVSDSTHAPGSPAFSVQQAAQDQAVLLKRPDGTTIASMSSPAQPGSKVSFELNGNIYTWRVFRTLWRLQLTLVDDATQKQVAVMDLNGTSFTSYWKASDDTLTIKGNKEDRMWLGVVIATGMAVAKSERRRFKSQLGNEKANCKDEMFEPKRFSMDLYRASSLKIFMST